MSYFSYRLLKFQLEIVPVSLVLQFHRRLTSKNKVKENKVSCLRPAVLSKATMGNCNFALHRKSKVRNPSSSVSAITGTYVG